MPEDAPVRFRFAPQRRKAKYVRQGTKKPGRITSIKLADRKDDLTAGKDRHLHVRGGGIGRRRTKRREGSAVRPDVPHDARCKSSPAPILAVR